ncbi:MAG: hypothetical protein HY619_03745 [Thaumarchaeota archaeon]|nr:hypothetical protein [Nitrososphaerota archaeon]
MPSILSELKTAFSVMRSKSRLFLVLIFALIGASLLINILVLSAVTGRLPAYLMLNDGTLGLQASLDDPVDQFLEEAFPLYNQPFAAIMFPREFTLIDEFGYKENVIVSQPLFLNIHYFADFTPFAVLISSYTVLTRYYFSRSTAGPASKTSGKKAGTIVGGLSTAAPSVGSGTGTAMTALAAGVCCGSFAVESSIYVLGFAIGATGFIFLSRIFLAVMAGFLILGIFRTSRKINSKCPLPARSSGIVHQRRFW